MRLFKFYEKIETHDFFDFLNRVTVGYNLIDFFCEKQALSGDFQHVCDKMYT